MKIKEILLGILESQCSQVHANRLNAVLDVAEGLKNSQNRSLSAIGRHLSGESKIKHKIKKVDRCLGNKTLSQELGILYKGLSYFIFNYVKKTSSEIVIDLCYLKDDRRLQMLSAQLGVPGRSLPLYHEIFEEGDLKGRTEIFLENLSHLLPKDKGVIVIMDAGFHTEWFKLIEKHHWNWVCRVRQGKNICLEKDVWLTVKEFILLVGSKTKDYGPILLTKEHSYSCRMVTTRRELKGRKQKISRGKTSSKVGRGRYGESAREPWILATHLASESFKASDIVRLYSKRMQIEESFRDIKSHQFGLSGRYVRTMDVNRWGIWMLLASIVMISYWTIGVIGHFLGMQKIFQVNTVKDRKVFSYFTLGKLIIEFNKLGDISFSKASLTDVIQKELSVA